MPPQMPAPKPVQKVLRTRPRQKYSAARAFYLTILVISAIAILSVLKERRIQHGTSGAGHVLISRTPLVPREDLIHMSSGDLVRRDQAVRSWIEPQPELHQAYTAIYSVDSSTPSKTNALSSAPTAQMRKQASFPTYNCTIASCTRFDRSPSYY